MARLFVCLPSAGFAGGVLPCARMNRGSSGGSLPSLSGALISSLRPMHGL